MAHKFEKERVLEAIKGSMGIMSTIARKLDGCGWNTAERYVNKWECTKQAYQDEDNRSLDLSESKMLSAIDDGDGPMIRFHLATKGRKRGYVQKTETDITTDGKALLGIGVYIPDNGRQTDNHPATEGATGAIPSDTG